MKYHIEFLGLPGSGKSTLYNKLIDQKNDNLYSLEKAVDISTKRAILNYQSNNKLKRIMRYIIYQLSKNIVYPIYKSNRFLDGEYRNHLIKNPEIINQIINLLDDFNLNIAEKRRLVSWLNKLIAEYSLVNKYFKSNESVIIDEGFIHFSTSIWQRKKPLDENYYLIKDYIDQVPLPEILIYIDVDAKEAYNRMVKRGRFPKSYENLNEKDCNEKLIKMKNFIEHLIEILNDDLIIIKINNNSNINKAFTELKDRLNQNI